MLASMMGMFVRWFPEVSRLDVMALLGGSVEVDLVPDVEKGEVLLDSRGRGTFQKAQ